MPVDAIQWRVSVGMGNAGRVCPTKWRRQLHLVKPTMEGLCYQLMVSMAAVVLPLFFILDAGPTGQSMFLIWRNSVWGNNACSLVQKWCIRICPWGREGGGLVVQSIFTYTACDYVYIYSDMFINDEFLYIYS